MLKKILIFTIVLIPCLGHTLETDFSLHGYFRNRIVLNDNLDLQKPNNSIPHSNNRFGFISYNQMRLRTKPNAKIGDHLSLHMEVDFLDNILFGTKDTRQLEIISPIVGTQTLPPGAGSLWMTGGVAGENGAINVRRIWMDILTPIGKFRLGRQPSNWGLGIFQNDGEGRQADFGDTADRVMYLMQHNIKNTGSISAGLIWDIAYEAQFDPRIDGLDTSPRANSQDTQQYAGIVYFEKADMTIGAFGGLRRRNGPDGATTMDAIDVDGNSVPAGIDGDTFLYFADIYGRYQWENYNFKFEGVYLGGKITTGLAINAVPFSALTSGGIINLPPKQTMQAVMAAFEADAAYDWGGAWKVWSGYASGDADPLSTNITTYGFRPDYQIALLMFHMPMGTSPSLWGSPSSDPTGAAQKLAGGNSITGNYINNALYFAAGYKHTFDVSRAMPGTDWLRVGGKITTAWAPKKSVNLDFAQIVGQSNLPYVSENTSSMLDRWYGLEFDLSVEAKFWEHLYTALEGGILMPGKEYDINVNVIDPGSIIEPIPSDKASLAWMVRLTVMLDF